MRRRWIDRTRPLWRIGNRVEAVQLRRLGASPMSLINPGQVLLLETTGRRTAKRRYAPIGYWIDDDRAFVVGGGAAGMATDPDWVKNLRADPRCAVWVRRTRVPTVAHELEGADRDRAQQRATETWPAVPRYEARSGRVIPYFRLVPGER